MKRREFYQRLQDIDPEDRRAMEQLAELFEEDYVTAGEDLTDPAVAEDIRARAQADMTWSTLWRSTTPCWKKST